MADRFQELGLVLTLRLLAMAPSVPEVAPTPDCVTLKDVQSTVHGPLGASSVRVVTHVDLGQPIVIVPVQHQPLQTVAFPVLGTIQRVSRALDHAELMVTGHHGYSGVTVRSRAARVSGQGHGRVPTQHHPTTVACAAALLVK